jgi:hypothetical protein
MEAVVIAITPSVMYKPRLILFSLSLLLITANLAFAAAGADGPPPSVPDLATTIADLRSKHEGDRFAFVQDLTQRFEHETDIPALRSLVDLGGAIKALTIELHDEDYVARACDGLVNQSLVSLSKLDSSDSDRMVDYYRKILSEDDHFALMQYWMDRLPTIEDLSLLNRLLVLGGEAIRLSRPLEDGRLKYVPEQARRFVARLSERMIELNPYNEGVFQVTLSYPDGRKEESRLVSVQPRNGNGLSVGFVIGDGGSPAYLFPAVSFTADGQRMVGTSYFRNVPAMLVLQFDRDTGKVKGSIRQTLSAGDILFEGTAIKSAAELFRGPPPKKAIDPGQPEGVYQGRIGELQGTLIIKRIGEREYGATFLSANGYTTLNFQKGELTRSSGVLTFIENSADQAALGKLGLTISLPSEDPQSKIELKGWGYMMRTGKVMDVSFVRSGDVDPYQDPSLW